MEPPTPQASGGPAVEARNLLLGYGKQAIVRIARFAAERGSITGLEGPNGSGKSTFLRACAGLLRPLDGSLKVLGAAAGSAEHRMVLRRCSWMSQQLSPPSLPIRLASYVASGRPGPWPWFNAADTEAVAQALSVAGLEGMERVPLASLSGGQARRAALARALATKPELLLLDEPDANLDQESLSLLLRVMARLAEQAETSVLVVSHHPAILDLCRRVLNFGNGLAAELAGRAHD